MRRGRGLNLRLQVLYKYRGTVPVLWPPAFFSLGFLGFWLPFFLRQRSRGEGYTSPGC